MRPQNLVFYLVILAVAAVIYTQLPDIQRYLKIRSM